MTLKLDNFGRLLIPKLLRQFMGIEQGGKIEVHLDHETKSLTLRPHEPMEYESEVVYDESGFPMIVTKKPFPVDFDTVEFFKETLEEYLNQKFGF